MSRELPVEFGRYQLVELLGRGGMAEVWKARLVGTAGVARTVVVKRIRPAMAADAQFAQLFAREARLSAQLTHANIVQVFEYGEHAGEPYLAMEYVPGRDLNQVIAALGRAGKAAPVGLAVYVAREVARALAYAHGLRGEGGQPLGLVHRDISPSNVILGLDGSVKLLDFGIAKALTDAGELTQAGTFKGKVGYSAPEVTGGAKHDGRSDLFALGVVLYETLVGHRLFRGASDVHTLFLAREAKVTPPSEENREVPPELDRITLKALARDPQERYQRAEELAHDLDGLLHEVKYGAPQLAALLEELFAHLPERRLTPERATPEPGPQTVTEPESKPPGQRARPGLLAVAGALVLGLGGTGAWLALGRAPEPAKPAAQPAVVAPTKQITVTVTSKPAGAQVSVEGEPTPRGLTPLTLTFSAAAHPTQVAVVRAGYEKTFGAISDAPTQQLDVRLKPQRKVDVKGGSILEPFDE